MGVQRFGPTPNSRGVLAVSFARSATGELRRRVRTVWGSSGLQWPHRVRTIDSLICEIVHCLLRQGAIRWPNNLTTLKVLDTWQGQRGCRYLTPEQGYRRVIRLTDGYVTSVGRRVTRPGYGIGTERQFDSHVESGVCTHDEIRGVLAQAVSDTTIRGEVQSYLACTLRTLIIDEIFDANPLDLAVVVLAD